MVYKGMGKYWFIIGVFSLAAFIPVVIDGYNPVVNALVMLFSGPPIIIYRLLKSVLSSDSGFAFEQISPFMLLVVSLGYYTILFFPFKQKTKSIQNIMFIIHATLILIIVLIFIVFKNVH